MYSITDLATCATFLLLLNMCRGRGCFLDPTLHLVTNISSNWVESTSEPPIKPERDIQAIVLSLEEPYIGDFETKGVDVPDGSLEPRLDFVEARYYSSTMARFTGWVES